MKEVNVSNHHITINTNQVVNDSPESRRFINRFKRIIRELFSRRNADNLLTIFRCESKQPIHKMEIRTAVEWRSAKYKMLHAHILIFLTYDKSCYLHVNYDYIRLTVKQALGIPIWFYRDFLKQKQSEEDMKKKQIDYIMKEILRENRE